MGVPTLYVRLLAEPALTREACREHAPLHQRLGAAPARHLRGVPRAHRPHHPRALRHERDGDADVEPVRPGRRRAARRHGGLPAAGRRPARRRRRRRASCPPATVGGDRGARPERVRGLLAHAREDARGVHAPTAGSSTGDVGTVDDARLRHASSAAARTSSSAAATTSTRPRSRACSTSCPASPRAP